MKKLNKKLQLNKEVKNKYSHFLTPFCLVLVSCIFPVLLFAQHRKFTGIIEGIILDVNTRLPVPYARVHNLATGMETASNKDGLFSIHIVDYNDVIPIHHLGYQDDTLKINPNLKTNTVYLKPNTYELKEVIVKKKKTDYLYTLLEQCRDKMGNWLNERSAKAYYELKTYVNGQQVELAEAFYNADLGGHDLKKLHLKNGRFALQTWEDRTFVSLDGSTVFTKSKLFTRDAYFPFSPVEFNKTLIKKYFQLKLQSILPMPDDTLYRVSFTRIVLPVYFSMARYG
jgi:hypothetical protein